MGSSTWLARAMLLLFLVKMHWGMWDTWEWTLGDEPEHLNAGVQIFQDFAKTHMGWSPLYRFYFGAVFLFTENAFLATWVHRLIVVVATVFVFFEILRRLMPLPVALVISIWWMAIPSNLNPLYTIHVFAHLVNLVALLGFVVSGTPRGRGISLALLGVSALFVRTEATACLLLMIVSILWFEWRNDRKGRQWTSRRLIISYGAPLALVFATWCGLSAATKMGMGGTFAGIQRKAALTFSHNFSFTYFQQNPDPNVNVWHSYPRICKQEFGKEVVSLGEAARRNPSALGAHIRTNLENLVPGMQLAFFNVRAAERNPEMVSTIRSPGWAWLGSVFLVAVWGAGGWLVWREREYFLDRTFRPNAFAWICLGGFFLQAIPVAVIILARPSFYLSGLASLFVVTGLCLWAIWRKMPAFLQSPIWLFPATLIALIWVPSPWTYLEKPYDVPRAVFDALGQRRLIMAETGTHLVAGVYQPRALSLYLDPELKIIVEGMETVAPALDSDVPLGKWLYDRRAKLFFACGEILNHEAFQDFHSNPREFGWMLTGRHHTGNVYWSLYEPIQPYPEDLEKMKVLEGTAPE